MLTTSMVAKKSGHHISYSVFHRKYFNNYVSLANGLVHFTLNLGIKYDAV